MKTNSHTLANPKDHVGISQLIRNEGFIYTNQDVQDMLHCSRSYINQYIRPNVDHVITSKRVRDEMEPFFNHIREGKELDGYILYSMNSLNKWFHDNVEATRQAIRINMYPYIRNVRKFQEDYRDMKMIGHKQFFFSSGKGMILSDHLTKKGLWILNHSVTNRNSRSETEAVPLDNFLEKVKFEDIYRDLKRPREISVNDETARRKAFYKGMIRLSPESELIYYYNPHDMLFSEFPDYSIVVPYRFFLDNENEIRDVTHQSS